MLVDIDWPMNARRTVVGAKEGYRVSLAMTARDEESELLVWAGVWRAMAGSLAVYHRRHCNRPV